MAADLVLPNLGFGMEEGRLIAWLKAPGDSIRKGDAVAEIEGDKATVELEATVAGVLGEILVQVGDTVPVGTVLARVRTGDSASAAPAPVSTPTPSAEAEALRVSPVAQRVAREHGVDLVSVSGSGPGGRITRGDVQNVIDRVGVANGKVLAAPAVRKLARDNGLDLTTVRGSGVDGHVTRADVEAKLRVVAVPTMQAPTAPAPVVPMPVVEQGERVEAPLSRIRQTIARQLAKSAQEAPHFYTTAQLDLTAALSALPGSVGLNALLLYLTVQTLKQMSDLNATYEDGHLYHYAHVNLAVAVALPDGLITPVLQHADDFSLTGLAERSKDLITRARANRLHADELSGGTFTVSNLGIVEQVERFTAILNPPQVAILAVGAAKPRPLVIDGGLHIRTTAYFTLSADHRIVDGLIAARFLEAFDQHLQRFAGT